MTADPFDLERFIKAQDTTYSTALAETRNGRKQSHWIWFILPQLRGLGSSWMADRYGLSGIEEAQAYLKHPVLGPRLLEVVEALLQHRHTPAEAILGSLDARKFHSCLTLFLQAAPQTPLLKEALRQFFNGEPDAATLRLLATR